MRETAFLKKFFWPKITAIAILAFIVVSLFRLVRPQEVLKLTELRLALGTNVKIDVCVEENEIAKAQEALNLAWLRFYQIEKRMSRFETAGDVYKINTSYPSPVFVHSDTYYVLQKSLEYSRLSQGAFDITVGKIENVWKQSEKMNQFPSTDSLRQALEKTGMDKIHLLGNNQVKLLAEGVKIDLGAIAKGYAIDEAARILRMKGFQNFLVNAGGDLFLSGQHCEGRPWVIGIRDPLNPKKRRKIMHSVDLTNTAVTTSGDYERYYKINGKKYSHIIDPLTGYPAQHVASATVIAPNATQADAFSTALSVMGGKKGLAWIRSLDQDIEIYIAEKDQSGKLTQYKTANYPMESLSKNH
ncbi:MAG: FAD:protein FMN transferase [Candidatus Aceula meridiana]|nr:FAD:protein FMN transferase [Candidatus Aceula meridiana]